MRTFGDQDLSGKPGRPWVPVLPGRVGGRSRGVPPSPAGSPRRHRICRPCHRADVVHCHTWYADFGGLLAKLFYGIPLVVTAHSIEPLRPWKREQFGRGADLSAWVERTALEAADAVIAVSQEMKADILRHFRVAAERVPVIHNGIDTDEYRRVDARDRLARFGIDLATPTVLFVGRISRQKGILHLIAAIPRLDPHAQVVLCAGRPDSQEIAREVEAAVAQTQAARSGVIWIREMVDRPTAVQLYSHASVFCCPSIYEPFGIINLEAMACETPVVATAVGGIPEVVVDGETGFLVPVERQAGPRSSPSGPKNSPGIWRDPSTFSSPIPRSAAAWASADGIGSKSDSAGARWPSTHSASTGPSCNATRRHTDLEARDGRQSAIVSAGSCGPRDDSPCPPQGQLPEELAARAAAALPGWLPTRRWFGSKTRSVAAVVPVDAAVFREPGLLAIFEVRFADGERERYNIPVLPASGKDDIRDAMADPEFCLALLERVRAQAALPAGGGRSVSRRRRSWRRSCPAPRRPSPARPPSRATPPSSTTPGPSSSSSGGSSAARIRSSRSRTSSRGRRISRGPTLDRLDHLRVPRGSAHHAGRAARVRSEPGRRVDGHAGPAGRVLRGRAGEPRRRGSGGRRLRAHAGGSGRRRGPRLGTLTGRLHPALASAADPALAPEPITAAEVAAWRDGMQAQLDRVMQTLAAVPEAPPRHPRAGAPDPRVGAPPAGEPDGTGRTGRGVGCEDPRPRRLSPRAAPQGGRRLRHPGFRGRTGPAPGGASRQAVRPEGRGRNAPLVRLRRADRLSPRRP